MVDLSSFNKPLQFPDPTAFLQLLNQRRGLQLEAERFEFAKMQAKLDRELDAERLNLAKAARLESETNSEVQRRLDEARISEMEQDSLLKGQAAGLLDIFRQKFSNAQTPTDLEANLGAAKDLIGKSPTLSPIRKITGGVEAAVGSLFKSFGVEMNRFLADPNPIVRLQMANLITTPGTESNSAATPEDIKEGRATPGSILTELTGAVNSFESPASVASSNPGIGAIDFAMAGQSVLSRLDSIEAQGRFPGMSTPDTQQEVELFNRAIESKRNEWRSHITMVKNVEKLRSLKIGPDGIEAYPNVRADLDAYYKTFSEPVIKYAPLPQAVQSVDWYAGLGIVPDSMTSFLANPSTYDSPEGAYRAAVLVDTIQRSGVFSSQYKMTQAFDGSEAVNELVKRINGWRGTHRQEEIAAIQAGPEAFASLVGNVYVDSVTAITASAQLAAGAAEDTASKRSSTQQATIGGQNIDLKIKPENVATSRDIARSMLHKSGLALFSSSLADKLDWNRMEDKARTVLVDETQRIFGENLARGLTEERAWEKTEAEIRRDWGPNWVGPKRGKTSSIGHPKMLAREQGLGDIDEAFAESVARVQLDAEILAPLRAKGKDITFDDVNVQLSVGVDENGFQRSGYLVSDSRDGVPLNDGLWFPDFRSADVAAMLQDTPDAKRVRRIYGDAESTAEERRVGLAKLRGNLNLWKAENRWRNAKMAFDKSPSPSTRHELNKANSLLLEFMNVPEEPEELLRIPAGPERERRRAELRGG